MCEDVRMGMVFLLAGMRIWRVALAGAQQAGAPSTEHHSGGRGCHVPAWAWWLEGVFVF